MTNSADPDEEANWSGSALFAKTGHVKFSKRRVNMLNFERLFHFLLMFPKTAEALIIVCIQWAPDLGLHWQGGP